MRISKLEIENIGPFEKAVIEFPEKNQDNLAEIHILTGENGTGKSTTLYAITAALLDNTFEISKRLRHSSGDALFRLILSEEEIISKTFKGRGIIKNSESPLLAEYRTALVNNSTRKNSFAFFAYSGFRTIQSQKIKGITELTTNPLIDALNFSKPIDSSDIFIWIANSKAKQAFAFQKGDSERAEKFRSAVGRIEEAISAIIGREFLFHFVEDPIGVSVNLDGKILSFDVLPDGLKSILSWISDLLMRLDRTPWENDTTVLERNFVLLLDEIDVHLHPAWQRKILPVVQKLFANAQIIITTHSPFVVGSVEHAWIHKLVFNNGGVSVNPPVESKAGESVLLVLDEIFDIQNEEIYDVETEKQLKEFYELRDSIIHGSFEMENEFLHKAKELSEKGDEIKNIVGREIRQINRLRNKEYAV